MTARTSQSLRSSENRHSSGAIDEFRSTAVQAGLHAHPKRPRHKRRGHGPANGGLDQEPDKGFSHETKTQPHFKAPARRLISRTEPVNDGIEDDESQVTLVGPHSASANGRGNMLHNAAVFAPIPSSSSEDELNGMAPPSTRPKLRDQMTQSAKTKERQRSHATFGIKRSLESPDVLQDERPSKRRHEPSGEGDITRTKFGPSKMGSARGRLDAFRVIRAACEPGFIYSFANDAREEADGASNLDCYLLPSENASQQLVVTDKTGAELEALGWISPNLRRINDVYHNTDSPIITLKSASGTDSTTNFTKGPVTILEFESCGEAEEFVNLVIRTSSSIRVSNKDWSVLRVHVFTLFANLLQ